MANERVIITDPADFEKPGIKEAITRWLTAEKQYESEGILTLQTEEDWAKWLHTHPDVPYDLWYDKELNDQYLAHLKLQNSPQTNEQETDKKKVKDKKKESAHVTEETSDSQSEQTEEAQTEEKELEREDAEEKQPEVPQQAQQEEEQLVLVQLDPADPSQTVAVNMDTALSIQIPDLKISLPTPVELMEDPDYQKIRQQLIDSWAKDSGKRLDSREGEGFLASLDPAAYTAFSTALPNEAAMYMTLEKNRIYDNPLDDPAYRQVRKITEKINAQKIQNEKERPSRAAENKPDTKRLATETRIAYLNYFAEQFPEKAAAYAKKGDVLLQTVLEHREKRKQQVPTQDILTDMSDEDATKAYDLSQFRKEVPIIQDSTEGVMSEEEYIPSDEEPITYPSEEQEESSPEEQPQSQESHSSQSGFREEKAGHDRANSLLSKFGKNKIGGLLRGLGGAGAGGEAATAAVLTSEIWIPILVILLLLVLVLLIMLGGGDSAVDDLEPGQIPVTISKTGPSDVANSEAIAYTIQASYAGVADDVVITDIIPDNADLVEDETTQPYTYDPSTRTITWSLREMQQDTRPTGGITPSASPAAVSTFPQELYESYGFPPPESPNPITLSGENLQNWQQNMEQYAEEVADKIGVDIGLIGMWPLLEQINYTTLYDNCNDPGARSGLGVDTNPNTPCPYINWQVGFGVRPMDIYPYLAEAMAEMHPGQTAQEVGQSVMAKYQEAGQPITYPSQAFPQTTIEELLNQIQPGVGLDGLGGNQRMPDESALAARTYVALLMKDEAVSTYILGKIFDQLSGTQMASAMESWNSTYYNRQKVINHIAAVHTSGVTEGIRFSPQSVTLTLLPTEQDTYITNQATAHVIGAQIGSGSGGTPNDDNCGGYYDLTRNALGQNFGDPECTMLANDNPTHMDNLYLLLEELDPNNALYWFTTIIPCESNFIPNAYLGPAVGGAYGSPDAAGAWGMFQMGRGLNGEYDHGDVVWELQVSNAINYNNMLREINLEWQYWECARG